MEQLARARRDGDQHTLTADGTRSTVVAVVVIAELKSFLEGGVGVAVMDKVSAVFSLVALCCKEDHHSSGCTG